ncbi:Uncharacterised protein [Capnocytophaga ochracea]|uniref:Uncharacterized protein n=1 Tax=Capnocytophaga ochracea TaxID=1018 RepID=A0A7Z9CAU0_CAPOC|nr:Uncharacterised protein [Capnocytophaga ochracea]
MIFNRLFIHRIPETIKSKTERGILIVEKENYFITYYVINL